MQGRIVELIGRINHDEVTAELLRLNDELNNLFLRHQRYEKNRDPQSVASTPSAILGVAMGVPVSNGLFLFPTCTVLFVINNSHCRGKKQGLVN